MATGAVGSSDAVAVGSSVGGDAADALGSTDSGMGASGGVGGVSGSGAGVAGAGGSPGAVGAGSSSEKPSQAARLVASARTRVTSSAGTRPALAISTASDPHDLTARWGIQTGLR